MRETSRASVALPRARGPTSHPRGGGYPAGRDL